jgi:acyl-CoA synthetase (NDP forming)/RimJ/RimL family protein N-acetyltransferase
VTYPAHWEADVVLADGGTVHVRPIRPDDADRLRAMHGRLSTETVYMRFFAMVRTLSARDVERFTTLDHDERVALVAVLRDELIGVVRYARVGETDAEVAVVVEDAHQGRGLGPVLLEHLSAAAEERGVERFTATVLPNNRRMLDVFTSAGFEIERHLADGYIELSYPIRRTAASVSVSRAREHRAEAQSVARLLSPKAVAVLGASREPGAAGHEVFVSLLRSGFQGPVYPVNPAASHVASVAVHADIRDVPDDVDLAVIALPAEQVLDAVRACVEKRVRGLVVVSGGFSDAGEEGHARLAEVVRAARDGGIRLIGPNAMGVVNTDPSVSLHATFARGHALPGRVGIFSQSGALAGTVLAETSRRSLGLSTFVSIGDRADVSGNDLLQYWQDDDRTEVVLLHLQGFGNPRKFGRIARAVGRKKPVVALKSGRGARDVAVDALFRTAGVIRVDTLDHLFETAQLLALQPLPAGPRVGIVGTSSALAALAADACSSVGLVVSTILDLGALASAADLATALKQVSGSGEVDALLAVVTPHADEEGMARALRDLQPGIPLLASFLGFEGVPPELAVPEGVEAAGRGSVPSYTSPESAAFALSRAVAYAQWRATPEGAVPARRAFAVSLPEDLPRDGSWLPDPSGVLEPFGLSPAPGPEGVAVVVRLVQDLAVGPLVSLRLGGPVADLLADPVTRTVPLTDLEAQELVTGLRGASLLASTEGVERLLHSLGHLADLLPEVAEVVLDPVWVSSAGTTVGSARVRLLPPERDPESLARQLVGEGADQLR